MPLWTANDDATGAPLYAPAQFGKTPNTTNRDAMYNNTTANGYGTGETIGVYAVDKNELSSLFKIVTDVAVVAGGEDYEPGDTIALSNTGQSTNTKVQATFSVVSVAVASAVVNAAGEGYTNGDLVTITGAGLDMDFNVVLAVTTDAGGNATSVAVEEAGIVKELPTAGVLDIETVNVDEEATGEGLTVDITTEILELALANPGLYKGTAPVDLTAVATTGGSGTGATVDISVRESQSEAGKGIPGTGWVLRKQGAGNRSDRVQYELLAFVHNVTNDGSDDTVLPE